MTSHTYTPEAWRKARRRWRIRRRETGQSWMCVLNNHGACSGWFGRLLPQAGDRPPCTCTCHQEDDA